MAQDGLRVPAWKRLGLALKNQPQSGVAVPEHQILSSDPQPSTAYSAQETSYEQPVPSDEPAVNGKSPKLGKRKHQHDAAEHHQQDAKKSRVDVPESGINGAASQELPVVPVVESAKVEAVTEEASISSKPLKGDSNYRKKKEKPVKRRREKQDGDSQPQPRPKHGSAPSPNEPAYATARPTLLASTELDDTNTVAASTPQRLVKKSSRKDASGSPPLTDRRKSVAFTPDTKKSDGNTGQDYFKAWVAEQKGTGAVSQPPEVSNFVLHSLIAEEEKTARRNGQLDKKQATEPEPEETSSSSPDSSSKAPDTSSKTPDTSSKTSETKPEEKSTPKLAPKPAEAKPAPAPKGKKKDPSVYIAYLTQYHNDRENWKFNKAKQNDVVDNALNIFRIPDQHSDALVEYVAGLKGAGVIDRLRERCRATVKDIDEQDAQMNDAEAKKVAQEDAEQERILKERKRRKTDVDMADLGSHEYSAGFIRRLQRRRAEALLNALGRAEPVLPAVTPRSSINPLMEHVEPAKPIARKRKRRTEVSSDESSSDSSDDDSSDSDSDDSSDSEPGSGSDNERSAKSASSSGSGSDSSESDEDSD
jgi:hypothetical protein